MKSDEFIIKFTGGEADNHRIPAYVGSKTLYGITRSLTLVGHYLSTGEVGKRYPFSENVELFLRPARSGSLEEIIQFSIQNKDAIISGIVGATASDAYKVLTGTTKYIFSRAVGLTSSITEPLVKKLIDNKSGDIEAVVDATEDAMKQSHNVIGNGVSNILIIQGNNNIVNLNQSTKDYVNTSIMDPDEEYLDVSVASLNVNTGTGRIFIHEIGKTVAYSIAKQCDPGTYSALSYSLDMYANGKPEDIQIRYRKIVAHDGRAKKYLIFGAYKIDPLT